MDLSTRPALAFRAGEGGSHAAAILVPFPTAIHKSVEFVDLGPVGPLAEAIDQWRETLGLGNRGLQAGQRLRQNPWLQLEARLAGAKFVLISPDGVLGRLPPAALPGKQPGSHLLEDWPMAAFPVAQALPALLEEQGPASSDKVKNLLLLGGVDYKADPQQPSVTPAGKKRTSGQKASRGADWREFSPLPGTEGKVTSLEKMYCRIFADEGYTTLEGAAATKERFVQELPRHLYLHVATHGFFASPPCVRCCRRQRITLIRQRWYLVAMTGCRAWWAIIRGCSRA